MFEKLFVKDQNFYKRVAMIAFPIIAQNVITIDVNMI